MARLAPRVGRLRDLPRPLRDVAGSSGRRARLGRPARLGRAADRPRAGRRRSSSSAATSRGIEQHLDHIESLGANVDLPDAVLPGREHHRYDATTFERVDPLLGGDDALVSLTRAAHARGIRVIGDLTLEPHRRRARVVPGAPRPARRARARLLLLRRRAAARLRVVARRPVAAEARLAQRGAARGGCAEVPRRWLEPPSSSTAGGSTSRTWPAATRDVDLKHEVARACAPRGAGRRRAAGRRARPRLPGRPRGRRLARRHELLRLPAPGLVRGCAATTPTSCASSFWGIPVGCRGSTARQAVAAMRALPRRHPVGVDRSTRGPCSTATTRARFRDRRRLARAAARRRRPADDDCPACRWSSQATSSGSRAPGARTPGAPCRGAGETVGHELLERYRALIALRRTSARARARRHPLRCTSPPTRSPTCARRATSGCSASRRAPRTTPIAPPVRTPARDARTATTLATACSRPTAPRSMSGGSG